MTGWWGREGGSRSPKYLVCGGGVRWGGDVGGPFPSEWKDRQL